MPVLGLAAAAFLIWVSWVVAQRSRRVLNLGLVGAIVGVLVISWVTLAAQQGTAVATGQSRGAQFTRVTGLNTATSQVDTARRIQAESLLARSWPDAQAKAVTAAIDAAEKAAGTSAAKSDLTDYRKARVSARRADGQGRLGGSDKLALSGDEDRRRSRRPTPSSRPSPDSAHRRPQLRPTQPTRCAPACRGSSRP